MAGRAEGCNLLLITLDTTRADRLGCYGWDRAHTPHIDALAGSGTRFEQAYTHVPITLPAHACLMTGTRPPENGVRDNARYSLGQDLPTLAEAFRQQGYRTAAFVSAAVLDSRYGLARGFEVYGDDLGGGQTQLPAGATCDRALGWLQRAAGQRFMCWVHFFDPHMPYQAPEGYVSKTTDPYDAEVAYMDANVGRLVEWLRSNSLLSSTLIVVLSDHGESLGEHDYLWHSVLLYEADMRIALMFSLPGSLPTDRVSPVLAGVSDVMPTVLDLMGWPITREAGGASLVPALEGKSGGARSLYGETDYPFNSYGWSKLRSLTDAKWKYIRAPRVELYDRAADPHDLNNLAGDLPAVVERMDRELSDLQAGMGNHGSEAQEVDDATVEALRALGYVSGPIPSTQDAAEPRKNPRDMLDVVHAFRNAETALDGGRVLEAISLLEPAVERSPESVPMAVLLGKAYGMAGYLESAQRELTRAIEAYPEASSSHFLLAQILGTRERFEDCIQACRIALQINPDHQGARRALARAEQELRRQHEEIEECRARLRADPRSVKLRLRLSHLLGAVGREAERQSVLRVGLALRPDNAELSGALARHLATSWQPELRDGVEALRLARNACASTGEQKPERLSTLALALAEAGRCQDALQAARRARELYAKSGDLRSAGVVNQQIYYFLEDRPYRALP